MTATTGDIRPDEQTTFRVSAVSALMIVVHLSSNLNAPSPQSAPTSSGGITRGGNRRADTDAMDYANVLGSFDVREKAIKKVRAGVMPPAVAKQLDIAQSWQLVSFLENTLDKAAATHPSCGKSTDTPSCEGAQEKATNGRRREERP